MFIQNQMHTHINVLQSYFMQSAQTIKDCPAPNYTEIAMLGRSNVGKSSIINLLLNHKLAKSSSTPGKTKLINFFSTTWELSVNKKDSIIYDAVELDEIAMHNKEETSCTKSMRIPLVFIDFPGFGYAKVSKDTKKIWDKHLTDFIYKRQSIKLFCHLIDSRHTDLAIDAEIERFLKAITESRQDCKLLQIYTKDDKLNKSDYHKLKAQNKITISTLKKTPQAIQQLYHAILYASLNW